MEKALEVNEKSMKLFHEMVNEETKEIAAITWLTGVHFDAVLRKGCPLSEGFWKKAGEMISGYEVRG